MATVTLDALERELAKTLKRFTEAAARLDFGEAEYWAAGTAYWIGSIKAFLLTDQERRTWRASSGPLPF